MGMVNLRRWSAVVLLGLSPAVTAARAGDHVQPARGPDGQLHWSGPWSSFMLPYRTRSGLYGHPDFAYGRGPLNDLGRATLYPGFRGYGMLGSPGYGVGLGPTSQIDSYGKPNPHLWPVHGYRFGYGPGYAYGR